MKLSRVLAAILIFGILLAAGLPRIAVATDAVITLSAPGNESTNYFNMTNFTYKPVDGPKIINCKLYLNDTISAYLINITNNTDNYFRDVPVANNGTYNWYVQCQNNESSTVTSGISSYVLSVDKTKPVINLNHAASSLNISGSAKFSYNASDRESGLASCKLILDGGVKSTASPNNGTESIFSATLPVRSYTWSVNCTDVNGNEGASTAAFLEPLYDIDQPLSFWNLEPQNNTVIPTGIVTFNFTPVSVEKIVQCALLLNGTVNRTLALPQNGSRNSYDEVEMRDGAWRWQINCTTSTGKGGGTGLNYLNISSVPSLVSNYLVVKANSPNDNYFDSTGSPSFTYTPLSTNDILRCSLITNNSIRETSKSIKLNTVNSFSSVIIGDGVWNWRVECVNKNELAVSSALQKIIISKAVPLGQTVAADVSLPGIETPLDLNVLNSTLIDLKRRESEEKSKIIILTLITIGAVFSSLLVFILMHPKYKRILLRELGTKKAMPIEKLKFYVDQNLRRGVSEERIRRHLKKYNWPEKDVDDTFKAVYTEMAEELKAKKTKEETTSK